MKPTIAVWFSCGAASAVAAKLTLEKYGKTHSVRVLNNPIREEHTDNRRFLRDVQNWLGIKIEKVVNPKYPHSSIVKVFAKSRFMSNRHGAICTRELKKGARQAWEKENKSDWIVLGYTADEADRHDRFALTERKNILPVLIDAKITKSDCMAILAEAGIRRPAIYEKGFPNANCIGCVKATSPTYWNLIRKEFPASFAQRAKQSREIGAKLTRVKNRRIFLDELKISDKGRALKNYVIPECGIFCEEKV